MNKAILFCRVSSREQEVEGYSLPAQEKLNATYAEAHDFKATKTFAISESASGKKQREIFDSMLLFTKKNDIKILIVEKVDRLTRSLRDAVKINEWLNEDVEREVHFVKENVVLNRDSKSNEKFIWNIKVSVAQYYIDNLSEEVKKGQKEKLAQGWLPTRPPLGYNSAGEKGHRIHIVDVAKVHYAKKMFMLYETGDWSLAKLAEHLYDEGLRSENGFKIPKSRIHEYLSDPFYVGLNRWNGELYPGKQETFISQETFDKVQQLLKGKTTPKYSKHLYLFKGLIHCDECKGTITWETQKGIIYGHCNHYRNCSQKKWSTESKVDEQLLDHFAKLEIKNPRIAEWIRKALKEIHRDEIDYYSNTINELNKRHEQVQKRLDNLYDDKLDGKITQDFYDRKFKQFSEEKTDIVKTIQKHSNANIKNYELGVNIFDLSQRAREIYLKARTIEDKRSLVSLVFGSLTLNEGILDAKVSKTFQVLAEAVELTNSSKTPHKERFAQNIFEPAKQAFVEPVTDTKRSPLGASRPIWLRW